MFEALADARDAAQRVAAIVDGLRSFSSPHLEALSAVDPREALGAALHLTHGKWRSVAGVLLDLQPVPVVLASVQARMWDPFFTTKAPGKGTGLGLSIARSIVAPRRQLDARAGRARRGVGPRAPRRARLIHRPRIGSS